MDFLNKIICGDALAVTRRLPDEVADMCLTSPPYFNLRDYGIAGQIGLENTPTAYVKKLTRIFSEVRRILKPSGTLWLNLADSYNGSNKAKGDTTIDRYLQRSNKSSHNVRPTKVARLKDKDLIGIPWMVAFALRQAGWYLRQDIIWYKPNPMPESVQDRFTKAHEYIFLLSKQKHYYFNHDAIMEEAVSQNDSRAGKGRVLYNKKTMGNNGQKGFVTIKLAPKNLLPQHQIGYPNTIHVNRMQNGEEMYAVRSRRSVLRIPVQPHREKHFAMFPDELAKTCILAGCPKGGTVLDPFMGGGTTALISALYERNFVGCELNPKYIEIAQQRMEAKFGLFFKNN